MSYVLSFADATTVALLAAAFESLVGWPAALHAAIGHPVTWIGALIARLDRAWNCDTDAPARRRRAGVAALATILAVTGGLALALQGLVTGLLPHGLALVALGVLAAALPAQKSLAVHVQAVADALDRGLEDGRHAVSMIVGRNPASLDEAGVARAAIESLAENFSDGIVAPLFWTAVGGLPGGVLYKAANTGDSMIGHRTPRHEAFGWAAARFDDLVNLPASRLAALWLVLAALLTPGASAPRALTAIRRDAGHHTSPNAGWPEAAMAGALGFSLAGPRVYGDTRIDAAYMGDGRRDLDATDVRRALRLYRNALTIEGTVLLVAVILLQF